MTLAEIIDCARREIHSLPADLRAQIGPIRVYAEETPPAAAGFDDDQLAGAFVERESDGYFETGTAELWLFRKNIRPLTPDSVVLVVWHELAHAMGFEEHEVSALGLGVGG